MRTTGRTWSTIATLLVALLTAAAAVVGVLMAPGKSGLRKAEAPLPNARPESFSAPSGPYIRDGQGRVVFFHGVNAVYKRPPFELYPDPGRPWDFSRRDAAEMARLGFNVVRLGIIWEGLEPGNVGPNNPAVCSPGPPQDPHQFNQAVADAYLARVRRTVDLLGQYHIRTILDMHEDIYSSFFGGEGAPPWAVCTDGQVFVRPKGRWSRAYGTPALETAVRHFWANDVAGNLQGEYARTWANVARYFRHDPWVLGYDPINEPFTTTLRPGLPDAPSISTALECFYTGSAHPGLDAPFGEPLSCPPSDPDEGLIPVLRRISPEKLVFDEPDIYSGRVGVNSIGPMHLSGLVFNFHVYCGARSPKTGDPTDLATCVSEEVRNIEHRNLERPDNFTLAQPAGPAWFMSEFGASGDEALIAWLTAVADQYQLGWTYWSWKYYGDPTGSSDEALVRSSGELAPTIASLSRAYPQAVAGVPRSIRFDPVTGRFELTYLPMADRRARTVIEVPHGVHYPHGYRASVAGGRVVSPHGSDQLVVANERHARTVTVTVVPALTRG